MSRKHKNTNTIEKYLKPEVKEKDNNSDESDSSPGSSTRPAKKAKKDETNTNTKMPESLVFEKREGTIKLASWNVSGLNAALKKVECVFFFFKYIVHNV
jgi:hypothetical protein